VEEDLQIEVPYGRDLRTSRDELRKGVDIDMERGVARRGKEWSHGLWGCFDNCNICCLSLVLPCYAFGKNASRVGDHGLLCCLGSTIPLFNIWFATIIRKKVRRLANIEGDTATDAFTWLFCPFCALIQEGQELQEVNNVDNRTIARV
jgi:Cys-rich protein (TIGR01571 family)